MEEYKVFPSSKELLINPLAEETVAYWSNKGFLLFKEDIKNTGYLRTPILLKNGRILDGRHRYWACKEANIDIKYIELGDISYEETLNELIFAAETYRNNGDAIKTQLYLLGVKKGYKKKDLPNKFHVLNKNYVNKLAFIEKHNKKLLKSILKQEKSINKAWNESKT